MDLSTADTNKWQYLLNATRSSPPVDDSPQESTYDAHTVKSIRQHQRRLTEAEVAQVADRYRAGETLRELAHDLGCRRSTIGTRLAAAGITTRNRPATEDQIDEMVLLYESGLSLVKVGDHVDLTAKSVLKYLRQRGVVTRDTHGKKR